jgi:hypothetical protein
MAAIDHFFTISRVAEMLGADEGWLQEFSIDMFPEDGCLRIIGTDEESITAFAEFGVESSETLSERANAEADHRYATRRCVHPSRCGCLTGPVDGRRAHRAAVAKRPRFHVRNRLEWSSRRGPLHPKLGPFHCRPKVTAHPSDRAGF